MEQNRTEMNEPRKSRKGFAAMTPERQRAIASQGGRAAHEQGVAHEWNAAEAKQAGKKGGLVSGSKRKGTGRNEIDVLL